MFPFYRLHFRLPLVLAVLLCCWTGPPGVRAQSVPAGQGLVADSTELRVLRQFYVATGGAQWSKRTGWDSLTIWQRLPPNGRLYGVQTDRGDVSDLTLIANHLLGTLPAGLAQLRGLGAIRLDNNRLSGPLPARWGDLRGLGTLEVGTNALSGPVPVSIGRLRSLVYLGLNNNQFTQLPDSLGNLTNLLSVNFAGNELTGSLPDWLLRLPHLQGLDASHNAFSGSVPAGLGRLRGLQYLSLNGNQLEGSLPDSLGQLTDLRQVFFSSNHLSGLLPASFGNWTRVWALGLDHNAFTGSLPASLGRLAGIWGLFINDNRFTGSLPGSLGHLANLRQFMLSNNQFSGPLPDSVGLLHELNYFDGDHNRFTGSIPAAWKGLHALSRLNLAYNQLSGVLPDSLDGSFLNLDHNRFSGALPASYGTARRLFQLTLDANELTALPDFHASTYWPSQQITITGNFLAFDSYERNLVKPGVYQWFYDYGQRTPDPADTLQVLAGTAPALDGGIGGAHNHYQWQRQVGGQWVDLPGDTLRVRTWARVTPADAGLYRTHVTNRWVVGVELLSRAHYLDLIPYPAAPRNLPVDPNPTTALAPPIPAPDAGAPPVGDVNFVRTWLPRVALTDSLRVPRAGVDSVARSTTYLDGLGRPLQTVQHRASPQGRDLVQPLAYDALGRSPRQYLPYPAELTDPAITPQGYHARALTDQAAFYRRTTLPDGGQGPLSPQDPINGVARTGVAFAETLFEASPLDRVVAQGAAGEAWQLTSGHAPTRFERPNTALDSVLSLVPGYGSALSLPDYRGFYPAGELWGTEQTDASDQHFRTIEWKDRQGQLVLKQVEAARTGSVGAPRARWLRTAYAYDDFGHLRYVLPPEATKRALVLGNGPAALPATVAPYLFRYRYDARGRQIAKQVPGTDGETCVVFDQLDRPVLSQDVAQRARREWAFTKYDALGRIILSGLVIRGDTLGQASLQARAAADTATAHQYEQRTADGTRYPLSYTTDQSFPRLGADGFGPGAVLSVTSYDDYNFDNDATGSADASYQTRTDNQFPAGTAPVADARRTTGLTTRTSTRVLGVDPADPRQAAWLTTTTFYDERARPVQVQTTNARKGLDLLTTQLDFTGKVVQSVAVHEGPNHTPLTVAEFFTYDPTGRLLTTRQQLPGEARPVRLDSVIYNEIGQARQKTMGTGRLAQQVDFAYNIRGWLTQLNDPYHPVAANLFNLSLHYDQGFTPGYEQYGGNLTGQTWRSARDGVQRAYGYVYDPLNRLLQGDFVARTAAAAATPNQAGPWQAEQDHYRLSFASYDDNGNLLTLRRRGLLANASHATPKRFGPVDDLRYSYAGNRLQAVDDQVTGNQLPRPTGYEGAPTSLAGDFQEAGTHLAQEYRYDANGNLIQDLNKGITGIAYNHLNLPRQIHFGLGADSLVFRYTAAGQKVAKLVYQAGKPVLRTDYLGPYQYEQDSLRFFPHAEGRVLRFANTTSGAVRYQREFTFKDHLGNLRLAYRLGQVHTYTATLEQDAPTHRRESQQFDSLSVSPPVAVATGLARTGGYAARLNAGGSTPRPLGPLTQLTVQKGDTLLVTAPGLYPQATNSKSFAFSLAGFVAALLQPGPGAPTGADGARRGGLPLLQVGLSAATLTALNQFPGGVPQGYLRVLSFNEDSVLIDQRTVQLSTAAQGHYESLQTGPLVVQQNGYVTIYVGNESNADVYFDDVTIEHRQGLQVQENQYDPFGLDLAGVSGAAPGLRLKNFYQFNGKENQLDLGLNWNHQDWRFFDYQIGRWHVVDPMIEAGQESWTPYAFGFDNAIRYADADGRKPGDPWYSQVADWAGNAMKGMSAGMRQRFQPEPARGATRTGLRDSNAGRVKAGKPVGDWAVRADKAHPGANYPHFNVNTNPKVTGIPDPHTAIPGGAKTLQALETASKSLEAVNKVAIPVAIATDVFRIGAAVHADGNSIGVNTARTSASVAGGWAGAYLGAAAGSSAGAWAGGAVGVWFGGAGAVPGAAIGGFVGGLGGGILGAFKGSSYAEQGVDAVIGKK